MGIQEDIFSEFFKRLEEDEGLSDSVVDELKSLWESGEIGSKDKIFDTIKRGFEDVGKDQED